jgi:ubiquinone/menaquinone biosynthesis C-methylase UbiE
MKDFFEGKAQGWDNPQQIKMAAIFVNELLQNVTLNKNSKALEIGTGTGLVGLGLLSELGAIVLVDTSEAMLKVLKEKISDENNIELLQGNVQAYNKKDIDLVFSNMAFHHIQDIDSVIKHLFAITTDKAKIVISDLVTEDGSFHQFKEVPHKGFDMNELGLKFSKVGFRVVKSYIYNAIVREETPGKTNRYDQFIMIAEKP